MIVAWIWSIIWYLGLDPIKWVMMYILNEDGVRDRNAFKAAKQVARRRSLSLSLLLLRLWKGSCGCRCAPILLSAVRGMWPLIAASASGKVQGESARCMHARGGFVNEAGD